LGQVISLRREKQGRSGKTVIALFSFQASERQCDTLAKTLKKSLGLGGTAKDGRVELQGECLDKAKTALEKLGYKTKQVGG
jgi:translation initiation factor 1